MAIASSLRNYLVESGVDYEEVHHAWTGTSMESAVAANVPAERVAKCVVLESGGRCVMAILPACRRISFDALGSSEVCRLGLADENQVLHLRMYLAESELDNIFEESVDWNFLKTPGQIFELSIMAALVRRSVSGEGTYLDVSATDGVLSLMSLSIDCSRVGKSMASIVRTIFPEAAMSAS